MSEKEMKTNSRKIKWVAIAFTPLLIILLLIFLTPVPQFKVTKAIYYATFCEVSITVKNVGNAPALNVTVKIEDEEFQVIRKTHYAKVDPGETITFGTVLKPFFARTEHEFTITYTFKSTFEYHTRTITLKYTPELPEV